jgi:hypothetical protein
VSPNNAYLSDFMGFYFVNNQYCVTLLLRLKENRVFAYGVLDGFNGCWSVDLLDQCFLTNIYFDNMQEKNLEGNISSNTPFIPDLSN